MQKTLSVINLTAIRQNALFVRNLVGDKKLYAVVKADAYGHGAERVACELEDLVDGFCVAVTEEGVALRVAGVVKPILVFAPPLDCGDATAMGYYGLTATVCNKQSALLAKGLDCNVAVNTGMNRYGCRIEELPSLLTALSPQNVKGVYSHLYAPDNESASLSQLNLFKKASATVKAFAPNAVAHLSASGGALLGKEYLFDGVRAGIMLYGYSPCGFKVTGLSRALTVYARLAQETDFIGGGVGYNLAQKKYGKLYTYRLGYADGFARGVPLGEKTLCMDAFISRKREGLLPIMADAEEYAKRCGTICYEVLCSVTKRSERVYERRIEV